MLAKVVTDVVTEGLPEIMTLPPVEVPAAVVLPAIRIMASLVVLLVAIFLETVRLPVIVLSRIKPEAEIPLVPPTESMVNALLSTYVKLLTPLAARVPTLLLA